MKYLLLLLLFTVSCASKPTYEVCSEQCIDIGKPFSEVVIQDDGKPACRCESAQENMDRTMNQMMHKAGY